MNGWRGQRPIVDKPRSLQPHAGQNSADLAGRDRSTELGEQARLDIEQLTAVSHKQVAFIAASEQVDIRRPRCACRHEKRRCWLAGPIARHGRLTDRATERAHGLRDRAGALEASAAGTLLSMPPIWNCSRSQFSK